MIHDQPKSPSPTIAWTCPVVDPDKADASSNGDSMQMKALRIELWDQSIHDIECLPVRTLGEVVDLVHTTPIHEPIRAWVGDVEFPMDCLVAALPGDRVKFQLSKKRPAPNQEVGTNNPGRIMLEVVTIHGSTRFVPMMKDQTIQQALVSPIVQGFLVPNVRVTCEGRLYHVDTRLDQLPSFAIRLRCFPLPGGAPQGSDNKEDVDMIWKNDPWAAPAPSNKAKWDQLMLCSDHPFTDSSGKRLEQIAALQVGPKKGGVAFATRSQIVTLASQKPPSPTVILLPGFRDLQGLDPAIRAIAMPPQQVIVKEPSSKVCYKRMVTPLALNGEVVFKVPGASNAIAVASSAFVELVVEISVDLCTQSNLQHVKDQPLDFFRKHLNALQLQLPELGVYAYRQTKVGAGVVHQVLAKVPETARIPLLQASGMQELFIRQFLQKQGESDFLDHSLLPRYFGIDRNDLHQVRTLGATLKKDFFGVALTPKGLAVRVSNHGLANAGKSIMQGDPRFVDANLSVINRFSYLVQGFPFEISHGGIVESIIQSTKLPCIPLRSFRMAGILTWVVSFQERPSIVQFQVKIGEKFYEILMTPQESQGLLKQNTKNRQRPLHDNQTANKQDRKNVPWTPHVPATQSHETVQDKRIAALEQKMEKIEVRQDHLNKKVDGRFDEIAAQLRQVLSAVAPTTHGRDGAPSGETPPPKHQKL